ncbi:MAG: Rne/Rng family ribonuclease, partial [Ignavibacteria bacterium]|nr:Rne/Rng family ribonuclease [Ignavibacteria bacterium]
PQIPRLEKGKDIIVQVIKEPVGNKGFRVTSRVSLPGRYLVLLPFDNKVGVSKKIVDARVRRRLRKLVRPLLPQNFGTIIRTNAETADEKAIADDLKSLLNTWQEIEQSVKTEKAPSLIYKDLSTLSSVIRDLFNQDVSKIIIDNKKLFKQIKNYLQIVHPQFASRVELYKSSEPIFDVFGLEKQIETALSRKVFLPSGGYIVIDTTEAMVVIDVNSGRYAASMQQELNSLKTDLEAAREAVRQIRLRDIGGIIVIDFIDLEDEKNRKKVYDELRKEFRKDKAKTTILPMTEFGLVQITRQRIRKNVFQISREKCTFCNGTGLTISRQHVTNSIERWIRRFKAGKFLPYVILKVSPVVYDYLKKGIISRQTRLMLRYKLFIKLVIDDSLKADEFKFFSPKTKKELTLDYQ